MASRLRPNNRPAVMVKCTLSQPSWLAVNQAALIAWPVSVPRKAARAPTRRPNTPSRNTATSGGVT